MFKFMKKMTFMACAALLASAIAFTGCQSDQNTPEKVQGINTDIAISLPGQVGGGAHRMPGVNVQRDGQTDFGHNGMTGITLVPFGPSALVTTSSTRLGNNITLADLTATNSNDYSQSPNGRVRVYEGKTVPMGTSAFLFYGVSKADTTGLRFNAGSLTASLSGEPSTFTFSLTPIFSGDITSNAAYKGLIAYLNSVANASDGTKAWKNYTATDNEGMQLLFTTFSQAHVLNSFGIQFMMTSLYKSLMDNTSAIATAIKDSIAAAAYATVDGSGNVTLVSGLQNFPNSIKLPEGAVAVAYSTTDKKFDGNGAHQYGSLNPAELGRYVYPSQLWYTANTKIKTSQKSKINEYTGAKSWKEILSKYEKDNGSVNATTRSVALKDTIQYAVARLDVYVKIKAGTTLDDNDSVPAKSHVTTPDDGYPVTAVLVGGQKNVGFDFTQASYAGIATATTYTIYDTVMTANHAAYGTTDHVFQNSTLVLETPANENEFIAIEFTNTSTKDFYGVGHDVIPVGGKFYLVGQLTAEDATQTDKKVFKQDYTTVVKVAIKDLKNAYSTVPNLKAPELELGLSVDLEWRNGHEYSLEL